MPRAMADQIIESGIFPDDIFEKCKAVGVAYKYNPEPEILTKEDIENLEWASGGFHDAYIEESDPYWFGSTVIIQDGFVYFVDEEDMTVDQISDGYCWFKVRHMKYRIIPD